MASGTVIDLSDPLPPHVASGRPIVNRTLMTIFAVIGVVVVVLWVVNRI